MTKDEKLAKASALMKDIKDLELSEDELDQVAGGMAGIVDPDIKLKGNAKTGFQFVIGDDEGEE